jgi:hypothetical protein
LLRQFPPKSTEVKFKLNNMEIFLSELSTCYFEWISWSKPLESRFSELVELCLANDPELTELQDRILARTILSPVASEFPPSVEKTRRLLKPIVAELESRGVEVREEFYQTVAAVAFPELTSQFKSYFLENGNHLLSLEERVESIYEGTTGLTTWCQCYKAFTNASAKS